jgi:hypothetical protein
MTFPATSPCSSRLRRQNSVAHSLRKASLGRSKFLDLVPRSLLLKLGRYIESLCITEGVAEKSRADISKAFKFSTAALNSASAAAPQIDQQAIDPASAADAAMLSFPSFFETEETFSRAYGQRSKLHY